MMTIRGRDEGTSLIEIVVAMAIMVVVGSMLTAGTTQLYRAFTIAATRSEAQSQVAVAVLRLDKQLRYAERIHLTSATSVTYEVAEKTITRCYDMRVSGQLLQQRSKPSGGSYGSWNTMASGITTGSFTYLAPSDLNDHQRLQVQLTATSSGGGSTTKNFDVTFTALNTTRTSDTATC
jgi:type II secretory pathway pseudopilin PulG